jgi:hypothetical protein
MNHLYLSGKCIECCVILTKNPYHIKRIDNLSLILYQTKRSKSYPRILSLRNESRVSSPPCHPEPHLRWISSLPRHPERSEGSPLPSVIPNEARDLLFLLEEEKSPPPTLPKRIFAVLGLAEKGSFSPSHYLSPRTK